METRYIYLLRFILGLTDFIILNLCSYLSFYLSRKYFGVTDTGMIKESIVLYNLLWLILSVVFSLYKKTTALTPEHFYKATTKSYALHLILFSVFLLVSNPQSHLGYYLSIFYGLLFLSLSISRITGAVIIQNGEN